jgi:hypothetical protein
VTGASGYYAPSWMQKRVSKPNKRWDDEPNSPPRRKQAKKQTKAQRAAAKKKQLADEAESERKRVAAAAKAAATEATRRAKELAAQERLRAKAAREAETARVRKEREDALLSKSDSGLVRHCDACIRHKIANIFHTNEVATIPIVKYAIFDGHPIKGEDRTGLLYYRCHLQQELFVRPGDGLLCLAVVS